VYRTSYRLHRSFHRCSDSDSPPLRRVDRTIELLFKPRIVELHRCSSVPGDDPENAIRRVRQQIVRHWWWLCSNRLHFSTRDASVKPGRSVGRKGQVRESSREGVIGRRIVPPLDIDAVAIGSIAAARLSVRMLLVRRAVL
jgi:hypothetical protein